MNKNIVNYEFDSTNPAPLTDEQKAQLAAAYVMADSEIDTSDIPLLTNEFWNNAVRNPFYQSTTTLAKFRVDSDILAWLKSKGSSYQTTLNAILREIMLKELKG